MLVILHEVKVVRYDVLSYVESYDFVIAKY